MLAKSKRVRSKWTFECRRAGREYAGAKLAKVRRGSLNCANDMAEKINRYTYVYAMGFQI